MFKLIIFNNSFIEFILIIIFAVIIFLNTYTNLNSNSKYFPFPVSTSIQVQFTLINQSFNYSSNDLKTLLDMDYFQFLINQNNKCHNIDDLFMIIFVHSSPDNQDKRNLIRTTWADENLLIKYRIKIVFMIGIRNDTKLMERIKYENFFHKDIVQGNFIDTYHNMTYKHVMGLKWITYFCNNVQYVLKADDDIFIDLHQLTYFLKGTFGLSPNKLMACNVNQDSRVARSYRNKWRISHKVIKIWINLV